MMNTVFLTHSVLCLSLDGMKEMDPTQREQICNCCCLFLKRKNSRYKILNPERLRGEYGKLVLLFNNLVI